MCENSCELCFFIWEGLHELRTQALSGAFESPVYGHLHSKCMKDSGLLGYFERFWAVVLHAFGFQMLLQGRVLDLQGWCVTGSKAKPACACSLLGEVLDVSASDEGVIQGRIVGVPIG